MTSTGHVSVSLPDPLLESMQFEQEQWANGPASDNPFYKIENHLGSEAPGTLLKVEGSADTTPYTLPPTTALSRFVYQSQAFDGTLVPVSAYILWPFSPRSSSDGYHVVAWAHGTTGTGSNNAPSNMKDLAHHFIGPYQLALHGYVVVATDYAGLGVSKTASGHPITHQYLAHPAHANDIVYAVQAAREAFPKLSKRFVVAGYSQGGGAAWGVAQRQAISLMDGYLGAVAVCPMTRFLEYQESIRSIIIGAVIPSAVSIISGFKPMHILSDAGQRTLALTQQAGASLVTLLSLFGAVQPLQADAVTNESIQEFQNLTSPGHKEISGPLLVIQGKNDTMVDHRVTDAVVRETVAKYPDSQLEYIQITGTGHNPAVFGSQRLWMDWIADRFAGVKVVSPGLQTREIGPAVALESHHPAQNWWIARATRFYQAV